jgi:hypothetical protein
MSGRRIYLKEIFNKELARERLLHKWGKTGLLRLMTMDEARSMSRILPSPDYIQAILREPMPPCSECNGSGEYVGLMVREPCKVCAGNPARRK